MPQARKAAEKSPSGAVYATVHILPTIEPGDRIDGRLDADVCELLLARDEASRAEPKLDDDA